MHNYGMFISQTASKNKKELSLFFLFIKYMCMRVGIHVQVRGPFVVVYSLLPSSVLKGEETFHPIGKTHEALKENSATSGSP